MILYWYGHCPRIDVSLKLIFIKSMKVDANEYLFSETTVLCFLVFFFLTFSCFGFCLKINFLYFGWIIVVFCWIFISYYSWIQSQKWIGQRF